MNIFEQTPPNRRRYGLAAFIGLIAGVVSAFVKWGAEVPLPPRSPVDMFNAACGPESLIRAAGQIDCSRNFLNPPYIFLRDWLGLTDPNAAVYTFAGHVFNWVGVTHIIFSIVFAVGYCVVAEVFPKIKLWQGLLAGALAQLFVHMISFPLMATYRGFVFGQYLGERRGPASVSDHGASGAAAYLVVHKFSE